jgi:maltooligosyltrehalose trehalohydrolase
LIDDPELPRAGLSVLDSDRARWHVWAPKAERVELVIGLGPEARRLPMELEGRGFFGVTTPLPDPGTRYAYSLEGGVPQPDPGSLWQPDGVNAPSAVFFPERFAWDEGAWEGIDRDRLVIYELHVGTFTPEGTFDAIIPRVGELLDLGITAIELMPVNQFPGTRSWGYDGVHPFAVQNSYGGPEGLQRLVENCHRAGMAVLLDVVYNHFGPEGNSFPAFGHYLTEKYKTDWGPALNFDDKGCDAVRAMVLDNVRMWIKDYRFDGLRLDAADQIFDRSPRQILAEVAEVAHREAAKLGRKAHIFAETDQNDAPRYLKPDDQGGYGLDGHWTDDFHHAAHATLTGESNGYYQDFADGPEALAKALMSVFVNDGLYSPFRDRRHGTPATMFPGDRFVAFTQNHDQVGNRARSDRYAASLPPAAVRLAAGILLLAPRLPLLFMGEEYGEAASFPFFSDFQDPHLVEAVRQGRKQEFAYFGWENQVPDPFSASTRDSAVLSWDWSDPIRAGLRNLYQDLLKLRRECPAFRDFRHPQVRLLDDLGAPRVLEMIRLAPSDDSLTIFLNLGPEPRDLPDGFVPGSPAFRSEVAGYGASPRERKTNPTHLEAWEFSIFGPLAWALSQSGGQVPDSVGSGRCDSARVTNP